jgi:PAS domain S-box-containing protein
MPSRIAAVHAEACALDTSEVAVIATDSSGTILYWNARAESMYGWRADEAIGRNIIDVTPTHSTADEAAVIMEQLKRGETWEGDFLLQRRDGRPLLAHVTDIPVQHDGAVIGIVGLSRPMIWPRGD